MDDKKGASGSISGFSQISFGSNSTIESAVPSPKISAAKFMERLVRLETDLSPETLNKVLIEIRNHKLNTEDAHGVDVDNLLNNLDLDVLFNNLINKFIPGIPPEEMPSYTLVSEMAKYDKLITYKRSGTLILMSSEGRLEECLSDKIPVDYTFNGVGLIPVFPEIKQYMTTRDITALSSEIVNGSSATIETGNSTAHSFTNPDNNYDFLLIKDTLDFNGSNFIKLNDMNNTNTSPEDRNLSFYFKTFPFNKNSNFVTIKLTNNINTIVTVIVNTVSGKIHNTTGDVKDVVLTMTPSGYFRIGLTIKTNRYTDTPSVEIGTHPNAESTSYVGTNKPVLILFGVSNTKGKALCPMVEGITTISETTFKINLENKLNGTSGMIVMDFKNLINSTSSNLLSTDEVNLISSNNKDIITFKINNINVDSTSMEMHTGIQTYALSYDSTGFHSGHSGDTHVKKETTLIKISTDKVLTIGSTSGYLKDLFIYTNKGTSENMNYFIGT